MRARELLLSAALLGAPLVPSLSGQALRLDEVRRMLPIAQDATAALAVGDVDGDGDLDVYVGNGAGNSGQPDRLLRNDGAGAFVHATGQLPGSFAGTKAVAFGDVDGDGDLDVYLGRGGQDRLGLNVGSGTFVDATGQLPAVLDDTRAVALGDVDGDGDLDALVGNGGLGEPDRLYRNDGSGTFLPATTSLPPAPSNSTFATAFGDVDGDGDLDAFLGTAVYQASLLLNDGLGNFTDASAQLPPNSGTTNAVAVGDFDGDGDLDILTGGSYSGGTRLYLNNGSAVFIDASPWLPSLPSSTQALAVGDVDGDGDLDGLLGGWGPHRLILNDGSAFFSEASSQLPPSANFEYTTAVLLGDLDGDGDLDGLIGNATSYPPPSGQNRFFLNDGSGSFTDVTGPLGVVADDTRAVALGDVDDDGDSDILLGISGQDRLLLNDGAGTFTDAMSQLPASSDDTRAVALGDLDGDGDLDALIGNTAAPNLVYFNDGTGAFAAAPLGSGFSADAVVLGDVDGDGDLDAVLAGDGQNRLYLNHGTGTFTDATASQLPATSDDTYAVRSGDVDADGDLDLLIGNEGQNRLWLNDGSGIFSDATSQLPVDDDATFALSLGDVDADGDLDVLFGNGGQSRLYLNDGTGVFTDVTSTHLPAILDNTYAVALGDLDGDGDLDALMGNGQGSYPSVIADPNQIYRNDGTGVFVLTTGTLPLAFDGTRALGLEDLDGDGDVDAYVGNGNAYGGEEDRLLSNLARQLAWRARPGIGKPLILDLDGPPFGGLFLAFSLGTASLPIPPFGTLRLDPSGMNLVLTSILDSQGRASVTYLVPSNPTLLGATIYWQALADAKFTNLEITTLTTL